MGALLWYLVTGLDEQEAAEKDATYTLTLDCGNDALMHSYGLPTKADVMEWHYSGQWGYKTGKCIRIFAELPGDSSQWDSLYGIDGNNPAFDK